MSERFSPAATAVLAEAGWRSGRSVAAETEEAVRQVCAWWGPGGRQHPRIDAAVAALTEFGGLTIDPTGDGVDIAPRPFAFDPLLAVPTTVTLADVAAVLGTALFPIGVEGDHDALLVMDKKGRVFSIDDVGEWFVGDSIDEAIETLVSGRLPARLHDDGRWDPR